MFNLGEIVFSLNKGDQGAVFVRRLPEASFLSLESDSVRSLEFVSSSVSSGGPDDVFCIERINFDPVIFEALIEFDSLQECESSLEEDAGWCCESNTAKQYLPAGGDFYEQFGIEEWMVWPHTSEQVCLNGFPCQLYVECNCVRLTQGQCESRRIVNDFPRAFTQEQLDGFYPLADIDFFSLGKMKDLWSNTSPADEYCPLNYVVHDPGAHSSSSSISCGAVECGCDPSLGPCFHLDCGMNPGGEFVADCDLCRCVEVYSEVVSPGSSSSSSSSSSVVSGVVSSSSSSSSGVGSVGGSSVSSGDGGSVGGGGSFVATHLCVKDRPGAVGVLTGTVELKDLVPVYSQSNVYFVSNAAESGEMTNGASYDSSYPIYQTMAYADQDGLVWVMADYGEVGYFRTVRVGPPPCYVREGGLSTAGAVNGELLESGDGCDGSYYYSASVEYSVDGENWLVLGPTTYAPFFNDEKTSVGTELVGDATLKEARYIRVVGNAQYLGLSELHAADDTVSNSYCVGIDEYDQSSQEIVAGPYGSLVSCSANCPPPPLSFVCVGMKSLGALESPELGNIVPQYGQSNLLIGFEPAGPGEMMNGSVYDSSYPIYQTVVPKVSSTGIAWIIADYGQVGRFRKVRVGPPPCYVYQEGGRNTIGAANGILDDEGVCSGEYYLGATVQYSLDAVQWFNLGSTTEAPFLNSSRTLVGTELVGDDTIKEARYIRLYAGSSLFLTASELCAVGLDVDGVDSALSPSPYSGQNVCIALQEYDPSIHELFSGPHSAYDICVAECNPND